MERLVDIIAPQSLHGLLFKAVLLVACFTAVDYAVSEAAGTGSTEQLAWSLLVTFSIGAPFGIFVMSVMAVQSRLKEKLRYLSETDILTGLHNRTSFLTRAEMKLAEHKNAAILMLDVDHFKSVNDTYGHYSGDITLQQIGRHILAQTRTSDVVGRIGGEEFAVLLTDADAETISKVASQICQTIPVRVAGGMTNDANHFDVTVSVGGVSALNGYRLIDLMCMADEALYRAKNTGRNRVVLHTMHDQSAKSAQSSGAHRCQPVDREDSSTKLAS